MNFGFTKEQTKEKIDYAISAMNLEEMRNRPTYYLSGGEKKRVTIADIIALETEIIFFDEPTASLDPANIEKFKNTRKSEFKETYTLADNGGNGL